MHNSGQCNNLELTPQSALTHFSGTCMNAIVFTVLMHINVATTEEVVLL